MEIYTDEREEEGEERILISPNKETALIGVIN